MHLVLCIAHHATSKLPKELAFYQLERLAHITDRYDLNHIVGRYLDDWIEPHRANLTKSGFENWLYIAWQFGLEAEYLTLANHLAVHCEVNRDDMLITSTGQTLDPKVFLRRSISPFLPIFKSQHKLITFDVVMIGSCRRRAIADIFSMIWSWIEQAFMSNTCKQQCSLQEQSICTTRNGHGLQRYLMQHGLFPMLDPARETRSARRLFDILDSPNFANALTWDDLHDATCSLSEIVR